ncbi:hypothetical protein TSOC_011452 [Tetrabaena socialis]|uniref:Centrosomal protein of 70 kDa n=1 Tax=Tetrabaena socialis TaxID=47790 RepID=A0A2J7ZQM3_9CHLO|nr:hypothetical protein TSOC_011452 [Tetrabaena socialis]|eukprot:PNH02559.1 hypothetical protein TSOC_011452 [Tetrabaena socialis]
MPPPPSGPASLQHMHLQQFQQLQQDPLDVSGNAASANKDDDVLCGSPTCPAALHAPDVPAAAMSVQPLTACADAAGLAPSLAAGLPAPATGTNHGAGDRSPSGNGITAGRGGVAFSISLEPEAGGYGSTAVTASARSPLWPGPGRRRLGGGAMSPPTLAVPGGAPCELAAATLSHHAAMMLTGPAHDVDLTAVSPDAFLLDWDRLNHQLREAGFGGVTMATPLHPQPQTSPNAHAPPAAVPPSTRHAPDPASLHRCLGAVLQQYMRRNRLVAELLGATEAAGRVAEQQEASMRELQRETNIARAAADKMRRELAAVSSQQLPKVEARHVVQLGRLRSEAAKLKEALREAELDAVAKAEEVRSLRATVTGLQSVSGHSADVEVTGLRQRVAQLETQLRARDKEVEKLKATKEVVVGQAEDGQANALDRAYEAEGAARKLDSDLSAARTRVGQLEQVLRQRDRDMATMREDLQQIKACEAAATLAAQDRAAASAEAARRVEGEAEAMRAKLKELEGVVKASKVELARQRADGEALRSSAYEEVYRLEDECRTMTTDLAAARSRAAQLELVVRGRDREVAKAREEKEAARAAERERSRAAEEVSVKLESELTACRVRATQAEGAARTRERELARLTEVLRQAQGTEAEAWIKQARTEEGSRKLENDFTSLRLRVLQLEGALKGRDKEADRLGRAAEGLRAEAHELSSKLAKAEEAGRKVEAELVAARGRALSLEGHLRVKEREQERLVRVVESLKAGEAEVAGRQGALEEAARRLEGALGGARGRVTALEGVVRAREAAVERLNRQLEAMKTAEFERTAQASKNDEAARQADADAVALRQRLIQLEGSLRAKDRELERAGRQAEAARALEADTARRLADAELAGGRLEGELAAGRQRGVQLADAVRAREREVAGLQRALEGLRSAGHEASKEAGRTELTARKLDGEAAELRQRLIQVEGVLRGRERDVERQERALEAAQSAAAEAAMRQAEAEAAVKRAEADAAALRTRLAQADGAVKARERELERAAKQMEQVKSGEMEAGARQRTAEVAVVQLDSELAALRLRSSALEAAARGHAKEVERLTRVIDQSKTAEVDASVRAHRCDEAVRQVTAELAAARGRAAQVEASLAARDKETQRLQRLVAAAGAQAGSQLANADEFMRKVESDLAAMKQRAAQLAAMLAARDKQMATLRRAGEEAAASEAVARDALRQAEEAARKVAVDLAAERQRAVQLEGQVKSREREVERLSRHLDAGRDQTSTASVAAGREAAGLKEAVARAEAAAATSRARITQLESELVTRERQLEELGRLAGYSCAGDAEAAAAAAERAGRAEEVARRLDSELGGLRMRYSQLEHAFRAREASLDKMRSALADKVAKEERRLARDKAAHGRLRTALLVTQQQQAGGQGGANGKAAGALAAAARELRPVEIVGLYEARREAADQELAACRAEIRSLAEQLRDAQNLIALKERSGAWRTPQELADLQARIMLLERRTSDLQRELDRARAEAAEAGRTAERRLVETERRATQLKEDNEALVHELDGRPTLQDNRALKREVEIMEKRLLQLKGNASVNGAGAEAEGGETALGLAAVAGRGRAGGPLLSTAQRMARDRSVHRLGLRALEDWPKDVMVDLVQDLCVELDLSDATTLPAALRKTLRVVGAVPRMEAFIGAVCESVYRAGAAFVPPHLEGCTDPSKVLEVLGVWLGLLQDGSRLRSAMRAVTEALLARADGLAMPIHGAGDVVSSVRQLVDSEAAALTARESLAAAASHLTAQPEALLSRLVSHFMRLFDCPSLEGVVPAVNRLYVTLTEQRNFSRALAATLHLPADAGASACMARVHDLLAGSNLAANSADDEQLQHDYIKGPGKGAGNAGCSAHGGTMPISSSAPPPMGVEMSAALDRLLGLFGVRTVPAAAEAADKAVVRLRRLDEVLPRYQRLASQLFEALRCTSLEEVMPALGAVLREQQQQQF